MNIQVQKEHYLKRKYGDLNRFISYFYQIDLVQQTLGLNQRVSASILEIGKGNGMVSDYLKKLGFEVTTCDFDGSLKPDYVADIRTLPFSENSFDVVLAYEVLEHLPFEEIPKALSELHRVTSKYVFISLPYRSTGFELIIKFPLVRTLFKKLFLDIFLRMPLKFKGIETSGQHYWEIDGFDYSLKKVRALLEKYFKIVKEVRPVLNHYHKFFILEKI